MAITFFEEAKSIQLDFASEYLKSHPKEHGKSYEVKEVRLTNAGSGYMIYSDVCTGFFYKKETILQQLLEALQVYVEGQDGYAVFMVLDKTAKKGFSLGVDMTEKRNWFGSGKKFTQVEEIGFGSETKSSNPFLKDLTSPKQKENGKGESESTTSKDGTNNKK